MLPDKDIGLKNVEVIFVLFIVITGQRVSNGTKTMSIIDVLKMKTEAQVACKEKELDLRAREIALQERKMALEERKYSVAANPCTIPAPVQYDRLEAWELN